MIVVNRREIKYSISDADYYRYLNLFNEILKSDPDSKNGGYTIRSLYFDTFTDDDYYSKMNGEEVRKKIRLRLYDVNTKRVKLELKRKINVNQVKETVWISSDDARSLINCQYDVLLKYKEKTAQTIYNIMTLGQYRPVVLIDYDRRAFYHEENNIRLTLDSNIRSSETNFDIFSENIPMVPAFTTYHAILEVKFNGDLFCWIAEVLRGRDTINQSLSKYCVSRSLFDQYLA